MIFPHSFFQVSIELNIDKLIQKINMAPLMNVLNVCSKYDPDYETS